MQGGDFWVFPQIDPVIFSLGPFSVRWYGLMYLIGFAGAWLLANYRVNKPQFNFSRDCVSDMLFFGFMGAVLGGRIGYMLFYGTAQLLDNPISLFYIHKGGMSFHGGLIGALVASIFVAKKHGKTFFQLTDFAAPLVPIGLGAGRLGNFINGELWGRETTVPWGMIFPGAGDVARHPSQLYQFALEGVVLFTALWLFSAKSRPTMSVSGLFLTLYGLFRFIVEFVREPDSQLGLFWGNAISMGQILSLPMIFTGIALIIYAYKKEAAR